MRKVIGRRGFLGYLGAGSAAVLLAACSRGPSSSSSQTSGSSTQTASGSSQASGQQGGVPAATAASGKEKVTVELLCASWVIQEWKLPDWVKKYNAMGGDQVKVTQGPGTGWDTKVLAQIRQGNLTWDGHGIMTPFEDKVKNVEAGMLAPVDDLIKSSTQKDAKTIVSDMVSTIKEDITYKGKMYGIPYSVEAVGQMWINKYIDGIGLKGNPATWSDTLDASMKIKQKYESQKVTPYAFEKGLHDSLQALIQSGTKTPFTKDGLIDITGEVSLKACDWMVNMVKEGLTPPHLWDGGTDLWEKEKVGLYMGPNSRGVWAQRVFGPKAAGTGVTPLMKAGIANAGAPFWSNTFTVFNKAKHPQQLVDFYIWLLGPSNKDVQQAIIASGKSPVLNSIYKSMIDNSDQYKWMADFLPVIAESVPYPENPFWTIQNTAILPWISKMVSPPFSVSPEQAMAGALKDVQDQVSKQKVK